MARALLALLAVLISACSPDGVVDGRPYALVVPEDADGTTPLPLVLLLHGYSANGSMQDWFFDLSAYVDERGFLLSLPNGTLDARGRRFWNASEACCQEPGTEPVDDVAHLRAVIADVARRHPVDRTRIFLVGHSSGGFMSLRMACDAGELITGVVSVSGSTYSDFARCGPGPRVPILLLHGTKDSAIQFVGGSTIYGIYPGAVATASDFALRNGCRDQRVEGPRLNLESEEGDETVPEVWQGCPPGGSVELWRMEGAGHLVRLKDGWFDVVFDWLDANHRWGHSDCSSR